MSENNESIKEKKKQKAAMGIRPDDWVEDRFKEMAKKRGMSQTDLFTYMFYEYINDLKSEHKDSLLDCNVEMDSINTAMTSMINAFKSIIDKSHTALVSKDNELKTKNSLIEKQIETATTELNIKVTELGSANKHLQEQYDSSLLVINNFDDIKTELNNTILNLNSNIEAKDIKIDSLKEQIKERDKAIKDLEKEIDVTAKNISNIEKEILLVREKNADLEAKNTMLQANLNTVNNSIEMFNNMKAQEIELIKSNLNSIAESNIDKIVAEKDSVIAKLSAEIESLKSTIEVKDNEIATIKESLENIKKASVNTTSKTKNTKKSE